MVIGPGELDPGWQVLRVLEKMGLVYSLGIPRKEGMRDDLKEARSTIAMGPLAKPAV
jgi:hypothetical protein